MHTEMTQAQVDAAQAAWAVWDATPKAMDAQMVQRRKEAEALYEEAATDVEATLDALYQRVVVLVDKYMATGTGWEGFARLYAMLYRRLQNTMMEIGLRGQNEHYDCEFQRRVVPNPENRKEADKAICEAITFYDDMYKFTQPHDTEVSDTQAEPHSHVGFVDLDEITRI